MPAAIHTIREVIALFETLLPPIPIDSVGVGPGVAGTMSRQNSPVAIATQSDEEIWVK